MKEPVAKSEDGEDSVSAVKDFLIVGIGASAGGIQALKIFFENVAADSNMAYVVILHLSPDHESQLAHILQTVSAIPVIQVSQRIKVVPNQVYVVPPNEHLAMVNGDITITQNVTVEDRRAPVDIFFRTLAESHTTRAICVVLSGTGANGSMGLKRVKERGGAAIVQNPREAEFNEMPRNAIATDLVDAILNVAEMPAYLLSYKNGVGKTAEVEDPDNPPEDRQQALREIFTQLRVRTGHDFTNYKRATIRRRIERRITVCNLSDLQAYAAFLRENADETTALLKDLLISVTNFFRDKQAFNFIENDMLPKIFLGKTARDVIRIWVAGCATGEEAYSLAMLCAERTLDAIDTPVVQIFATDIDEAAIATAREGVYTLNDAADVSPERLGRFFTKEPEGFRIRRELREMVLFANHNVIKDPPFSRLDLVTCRNMLIYFNNAAQERVISTFHFALNAGAYLFLGTSESVDGAIDQYNTISREHHVFQSRQSAARPSFSATESSIASRKPASLSEGMASQKEKSLAAKISNTNLHLQLLERYAPPSILVNEEYDIVHLSERAGAYLHMSAGEPTQNLLKLIQTELRLELRTALYQAVQRRTNVETKNLKTVANGEEKVINIHVRPVFHPENNTGNFLLVLFEPAMDMAEQVEPVFTSTEPLARQLEEELVRSKAQLRHVTEQYEVQAEELKASNEELQAMNEELRSAAEELETSKEELQSINEELRTVNQELKVKIEEISQTGNDLSNLINSTNIGTIFLDRGFRVRMFTPAVNEIFNLIPADYGRPLSDITSRLVNTDLIKDAETVLGNLQTLEKEVQTADGNVFLLRVLPYRTADDKINGVVLTFFNITERKQVEKAKFFLASIVESSQDSIITINFEGIITSWNKAAETVYGYSTAEAIGRPVTMLSLPEELNEMLDNMEKIKHSEAVEIYDSIRMNKSGRLMNLEVRQSPVKDSEDKVVGISIFARDVTDRRRTETVLRDTQESLQIALEAARMGVWSLDLATGEMQTNLRHNLIFGYDEAVGDWNRAIFRNHILPQDREKFDNSFYEAMEKNLIDLQVRIRWNDGSIHWIYDRGRVYYDEEGMPLRIVGVTLDITDTKYAEAALQKSQERLRLLIESASDYAIFTINSDNRIDSWNKGAEKVFGWTESEAMGQSGEIIYTPEDRNTNVPDQEMKTAAETGRAPDERYHVRKNGSRFYVSGVMQPLKDGEGFVKIARDMTDKLESELVIHQWEERYRIALEAGGLATWDWNLLTNKVVWNEQHYTLFGLQPDGKEQEPDNFIRFIHPEDLEYVKNLLDKAIKETGIYEAEFRIIKEDDKEVRWMAGYGRVVEKQGSKAIRMTGVMYDITDRKLADDELKAVQASLNVALDASKMGVWDMDMKTGYVKRSLRHDQLLGYATFQHEWNADTAKQYLHTDDKSKFDAALEAMGNTGKFDLEARVRHSDGIEKWIHYFGNVFYNENREPEQAAGVIYDITDRKTIERQKDEFIGIASHELKTPVTSIKAYAEILYESFADSKDQQTAGFLSKMNTQIDRLTHLIRDLLDVTKISEGKLKLNESEVDINQLVQDITEDMQRTTSKHTISTELQELLPLIKGDKERLRQVFVNLLSNAIKYSPEANKIVVHTAVQGNKIYIAVADAGIGMSEETLAKLFERFFRSGDSNSTTFPGLGLGLYISMQIVKQHKGNIYVESTRGKGSVFTVELPLP